MSLSNAVLAAAAPLPRPQRKILFVQIEHDQLDNLAHLAFDEPAARAVLDILLSRMNNRNSLLLPQKIIQAEFGFKCDENGEILTYKIGKRVGQRIPKMSESTIQRALTTLEKLGFVERVNSGGATLININKRIVWADDRKLRGKVACFEATVYALASENPRRKSGTLKQIKGKDKKRIVSDLM